MSKERLFVTAVAIFATGCSSTNLTEPNNALDAGHDARVDAPVADAGPTDAPLGDAGPVDAQVRTNIPGRHDYVQVIEGIAREFIVYIPAKASGTVAVPVVFVVHGTGGTGDKFYANAQWKEKAAAEGFIVVFPTALAYCYYDDTDDDGVFEEPSERVVGTKWAAGKLGVPEKRPMCSNEVLAKLPFAERTKADHPLKDDVGFFRAMIKFMNETSAIDEKRIYATGFSNGGEMTSRLAADASDIFAAIAASAGRISFAPAVMPRPLSFFYTLGADDPIWVPQLGVQSLPLSSNLLTVVPKLDQGTIQPNLKLLSLKNTHTYVEQTVGGKKLSTFTYADSAVGASNKFHFMAIEDLAHAYPNGSNYPLVLADLLWPFFKGEKLP